MALSEQVLDEAQGWLVSEWDSADDIFRCFGWSIQAQTISRYLAELAKRGLTERRWRGNARFGCWEYREKRRTESVSQERTAAAS